MILHFEYRLLTIFIFLYRFTGGNFAAKVMHGSGPYKNWMMNEFEMMNVLHHPRLTRLVEVYDYKVIIFRLRNAIIL